MNQREIIEAMEAVRTDSDDPRNADVPDLVDALQRDAMLRKRCDRIRQWDRVVGDALRSGPVPEGLCDRLCDALSLDSPSNAVAEEPLSALPIDPIPASGEVLSRPPASATASRRRRMFSRGWLVTASVAAAALILAVVFMDPFGSRAPQLTADFADEVIGWTQSVSQISWQTDFAAPELRQAPFDASVQAMPRRWASFPTSYAPRTYVYDLASSRNTPAFLFCFPAGRSSLPASPPNTPFSTTGGFSIGAWQRGDMVYVLAVRGSERRYRVLIQSSIILG